MKNKIFNQLISKNYYIKREYQDADRSTVTKKMKAALKLNYKYRLKLRNEYRYPPQFLGRTNFIHSEPRNPLVQHFAKSLLKYDVISFDVFDTLIFRPFLNPRKVADIVGENFDVIYFTKLRWQAEMNCRERNQEKTGIREVTIEEIYEELEYISGIDKEVGIKLENALEIDFCHANPYMKKVFDILKEENKKIIIISDMFLSKETIETILNMNGFSGYDDIYVSCEHGTNKLVGGLFEIANKKWGDLSRIHIGDNYRADFEKPKEYGFDSYWYKNINEYKENSFLAMGMPDYFQNSYLGVLNKKFYCGLECTSKHYQYGYKIGGIYILGMANWIHKTALSDGVEKILFLSRDGQIYKDIYNKHMPNEIENDYLYWSRNISTRLYFEKDMDLFITRFFSKVEDKGMSFNQLIEQMLLGGVVDKFNTNGIDFGEIITPENIEDYINIIYLNRKLIITAYEKEEKIAKEYISRKINGKKVISVIDVGWQGTGGMILRWLIEEKWQLDCKVYIYNGASNVQDDRIYYSRLQDGTIKNYLFSPNHERFNYKSIQTGFNGMATFIFEIFTQSNEPSFVGFKQDSKEKFIFARPEIENYKIHDELHRGIEDFCEDYMMHFEKYATFSNIPPNVAFAPYLSLIRKNKIGYIYELFGEYTYSIQTVGRPQKIKDIIVEEN